MHITWCERAISAIFSETFCAVLPLIPVSISSKISVSVSSLLARTDLIPSMILESSPPEAILASGRKSSPGFTLIINSASSAPSGVILPVCRTSISNLTCPKLRSSSAWRISAESFFAAAVRIPVIPAHISAASS